MAKLLDQIELTHIEWRAIRELQRRFRAHPDIESIHLFGSVARGERTADSDIDLLVVTNRELDNWERHEIVGKVAFDINLCYDTSISTTVVHNEQWNDGILAYSGLKSEIEKDGIPL